MPREKIDTSRKKTLKVLVEDYLEQDKAELRTLSRSRSTVGSDLFRKIFMVLGDPGIDADDLTPSELRDAVLEWHSRLKPVWLQIKEALVEYLKNELSRREGRRRMVDALADPVSPMTEYRDLLDSGFDPEEGRTWAIDIGRTHIGARVSFSPDRVLVNYEGIRLIDAFLVQLKDAPLDLMRPCEHCGKIIIITRKGKRYHKGCAAKARQKEIWRKDPEGCREKERQRYLKRKNKG